MWLKTQTSTRCEKRPGARPPGCGAAPLPDPPARSRPPRRVKGLEGGPKWERFRQAVSRPCHLSKPAPSSLSPWDTLPRSCAGSARSPVRRLRTGCWAPSSPGLRGSLHPQQVTEAGATAVGAGGRGQAPAWLGRVNAASPTPSESRTRRPREIRQIPVERRVPPPLRSSEN